MPKWPKKPRFHLLHKLVTLITDEVSIMRSSNRSPSYIIRNPYSYCFRLVIPRDLQKFVGKTEMRYSLGTGYVGLAKSKARLLAGQVQEFFRRLRGIVKLGELTDEQIAEIVNRYFRNFVDGLEKIRVEPGAVGTAAKLLFAATCEQECIA